MCCIYVVRPTVGLKRSRLWDAYLEMGSQGFLLWRDFWKCEKNKNFSLQDSMQILIDLSINTWLHSRNQSFENRTSLENRLKSSILLYNNQQLDVRLDIDLSAKTLFYPKQWVGLTLNKPQFSLIKSIKIPFLTIYSLIDQSSNNTKNLDQNLRE